MHFHGYVRTTSVTLVSCIQLGWPTNGVNSFKFEQFFRETHHYDHTHDKSGEFLVDQACSVTHRLGKSYKFLLSVLSVFVSALMAVVEAAFALLECMELFVARKDHLLGGPPRIAAVGSHR
jgi:hypothetical protein